MQEKNAEPLAPQSNVVYTVFEMENRKILSLDETVESIAKKMIDELRVACFDASNVVKVLADMMGQRGIDARKEYDLYRRLTYLSTGKRVNDKGEEIQE